MLETAHPLGAVDALDPELAEQLGRAFLAVPADVHHLLPLPTNGDARVDGGEDPQALVLEEVGEALEDERGVGGVRLDDRHLMRAAVMPRHRAILRVIAIADGHVQPRQAPVQLHFRRHRARDEPEVLSEARGQGGGGETEGHAVGHLGQHHACQGVEQVTVTLWRRVGDDALHFLEDLGSLGRVGCDHDVC